MTIKEAKAIDMVAYLSLMGLEPAKIKGNGYWYHSPFRSEKTPSFKINRRLNKWYDFGEGKGGNLLDFVLLLDSVSIPEALNRIANVNHLPTALPVFSPDPPAIEILSVAVIRSLYLIRYYQSRRIPVNIADEYLKEVTYKNGYKKFYALGFKNDAGGYELRSRYFKGSSHPKGTSWFLNGARNLAVFEGFFDFLSFLTVHQNQVLPKMDYLILNSTSFFAGVCQRCRHIRKFIYSWITTTQAPNSLRLPLRYHLTSSKMSAGFMPATSILTIGINTLANPLSHQMVSRIGIPLTSERYLVSFVDLHLKVLDDDQSPCCHAGMARCTKRCTFGPRPSLRSRYGKKAKDIFCIRTLARCGIVKRENAIVMNETKAPKNWISIRVKPEEYNIIYCLFKKTTCKKLSQYVRKVLLNKPVVIQYQDASTRAILTSLNQVSRELSAIGNNFNQTVHKLHTLDHIPEIKVWAQLTESSRQNLIKKMEEIRVAMNQIRQQCVHK